MRSFAMRSTPQLAADALIWSRHGPESEMLWPMIYELHRRGSSDVFAIAEAFSARDDAAARRLAADILGQLGPLADVGTEQLRPFTKASLPIFGRLLDDADAAIVSAAASGLGHHYNCQPVTQRPALIAHPDARVRLSVAQCLRVGHGKQVNQTAIDMLMRLMEDKDAIVRDWATFGIGDQCDVDTPLIREALHRRLSDEDFNTRSEAMLGLARRGDVRVVPFIGAALNAEIVGELAVEAAGAISAPELLPPLQELTTWWDVNEPLLAEAIAACSSESASNQ
jgi:HEAT repeat protein